MSIAHHIVETSLKTFYRHGFHASGVDLLSQEAGVTKKTLYRHFAGKDALIEAALGLRHAQFMTEMHSFVDAHEVENRPMAYIEWIAAWVQKPGFHGCAFINASAEFGLPDAGPHQQAAQHKHEVQAYLTLLCSAAAAPHPEQIARQLFLIGEGMIVSSQVQGFDLQLLEASKALARTAWICEAQPTVYNAQL